MIRWLYAADNEALRTEVGSRQAGRIHLSRSLPTGLALAGPGIDVPAGDLAARITFAGPSRGRARMELVAAGRVITAANADLGRAAGLVIEIGAALPEPVEGLEVRLYCRGRVEADIVGLEIDLALAGPSAPLDPARMVGQESRKSYAAKIESGFFARYLSGAAVLEIGYKGYEGGTMPIVPQAIGLDVGYPGYDGTRFPFADDSFDAVYSSHCYEHIPPWKQVLRDWHRILKPGGYLVIVVPHQHLFERRRHLPSPINPEHQRFYTGASLLGEIEEAFLPNTYRIRHLVENDQGFDYHLLPYQATDGCYEIELVVEKLARPRWNLDDDAVRPYAAGEFFTRDNVSLADLGPDPWTVTLDLSHATRCEVWGPYVGLGRGDYEAEFFLEFDERDIALAPTILLDVGEYGEQVAKVELVGAAAEAAYAGGRVIVPFHCPKDQGIFEFRVWAIAASEARPRFKGVVVRYADRARA